MNCILVFSCSSARGRLEGNHDGTLALLLGPLAPDPVLYPEYYSAREPRRPRINPNATHILERGQKGIVGELLKLDGVSVTHIPKQSRGHLFLSGLFQHQMFISEYEMS